MKLTGAQFARIQQALLDGYTAESLQRLVRMHLDERLEIISGNASFAAQVASLIEWSAMQDKTPALTEAAHAENPNNALLAALYTDSRQWFAPQPTAGVAVSSLAPSGADRLEPPAERKSMSTHRPLLIVLAIVSALLMLLLGFLVNVASAFVTEPLRPYALWVFAALAFVFVASLAVLLWQLRTQQSEQPRDAGGGAHIDQKASRDGKIFNSPNTINGPTGASIDQQAVDAGLIQDSPNKIE